MRAVLFEGTPEEFASVAAVATFASRPLRHQGLVVPASIVTRRGWWPAGASSAPGVHAQAAEGVGNPVARSNARGTLAG